jgi:hypothetical protein
MIAVVGTPAWHPVRPARPAGLACEIALAAAGAGAGVELVGRTGDDAAGDALVLALTQAGVGHVALLRDPARPTRLDGGRRRSADLEPADLEPADVGMGLQYLTSFDVLVVVDVAAEVVPVCVDAATWAGAQLIVVLRAGAGEPPGLPAGATVLATPDHAPPAFARMIGRYAAGLARGTRPTVAFDDAVRETGWEPRDAAP